MDRSRRQRALVGGASILAVGLCGCGAEIGAERSRQRFGERRRSRSQKREPGRCKPAGAALEIAEQRRASAGVTLADLNDRDVQVRRSATRALSRIADAAATQRLLRHARRRRCGGGRRWKSTRTASAPPAYDRENVSVRARS